jgi:glycosyltransferase involved in cell wall biosynthesis
VSWEDERDRRVTVAFHETVLGGATRSVLRIVPLLAERGWRFSFWAPKPSELYDHLAAQGYDVDGAPRCIEYRVRTWRLPPGPVRRLLEAPGYLRRYRRFLATRQPALVHANSILSLAEALVASRSGLPTLLHAHEMLPLDLPGRVLRNVAWRNLDEIVAVSETSGARLDWHGRRPRIVHEAAPIPDPTTAREHPEPFTVGTIAVVSKRKGSDLFVEAARRLQQRNGTTYRFEMVGSTSDLVDREWARTVLADATAAGIEHIPSTSDVFERLRRWDAFVLPSRSDPFPLSMLEAMATGLPVVGARRDGIAEQIADGTGLLIEPEDPAALADAIDWMAKQPAATRARMGAAARGRVTASFTLEHQAAAMDEAYRATLAAATPARERR